MGRHRLKTYLINSDTHIRRLQASLKAIQPIIPLSKNKYKSLSDQELSFIDQMSFRFGKLQDSTGRLLRSLLILLGEDIEYAPFIDVLNRAEKLGIIGNAQEWIMLRELRNLLTNEYSEDEEDISRGINRLFEVSGRLCEIYSSTRSYIEKRGLAD